MLQLARAFLARFNRELNRAGAGDRLRAGSRGAARAYGWPGNVRELENAIERAVLLAEGSLVAAAACRRRSGPRPVPRSAAGRRPAGGQAQDGPLAQARHARARGALHPRALRRTTGNRTRAAELLEISHRALLYKIKEYGIDADAEGELG